MSLLTEVTVLVPELFDAAFERAITAPIDADQDSPSEGGKALARLDTSAANTGKMYCSGLFAGMFANLATETVLEFLDGLDWSHHEAVVVIIDEHNDFQAQVFRYPK